MSIAMLRSGLRQFSRKSAALALAAATAIGVAAAPQAQAGPRDWLRPDATGTCEWHSSGYWVQRCDVWSPAMNRTVPVLVQPASRGGDAGFYLLDGMRALDSETGWTLYSDAPATYADSNITLVMPIGGAGTFYTDWDAPGGLSSAGPVIKWETFLASELPGYLQQQFGVNPYRNTIGGLSMGGTAAMNLAARHPERFQQVLSFSGYLHTTAPGFYTLLRLAMLETSGLNLNSMYTWVGSVRRFENDPFWNMDALRGKDIYVSASSGLPGLGDAHLNLWDRTIGWALEAASATSTGIWEAKARATGVNATVEYVPNGVHNWWLWTDQLHRTKERVLNFHNAW